MLAITLGDIVSTRLLINKGANVNVKNDEGWTGKINIYTLWQFLFDNNLNYLNNLYSIARSNCHRWSRNGQACNGT